ncbi:MAG: hypothetical protein GF317_23160 [Candidatus Lokiarchaeota archaeon]|nr:hypothetical protein [Candidatus Lokiarchaeota archaeon]
MNEITYKNKDITLLDELKMRDICLNLLNQIDVNKKQEDNLNILLSIKDILDYYFI